ncbi:hypothetical protein [Helcococcus kunzii]|uniref:hypothetical protein n=1 Tax=Helcococcus kunzii TaxID=40091 RepID=UPI0024ACFA15|nr:hypothetical protein [Helcococcus kunzii]
MNSKKLILEKKYIKRLIIATILIIFVATCEAFIMAKSKELMETYMKLNKDKSVSDYLSLVMFSYFLNIIEPVAITVFTFFSHKEYGISSLYKIIFSAIIGLRILNTILKFETSSLFYYLMIILYIIYLIILLNAPITKRKVKNGLF